MLDIGTRVRVHKNLNTGQWVIRTKIPGKGWRNYSNQIETVLLTAAVPVVSEKGAQRIQRNGSREVVAVIEGNFAGFDIADADKGTSVHYNPWRDYRFTYADGAIFAGCDIAIFEPQGSHFYEGV